MEVVFVFIVTAIIATGVIKEVVVPVTTKAVEVVSPIVDSAIEKGTDVYDAGKELITGKETE
tara:strand:+ start:1177 stop:1362 length:186 start_codon:yes stop_codon:yes gene_type:complete